MTVDELRVAREAAKVPRYELAERLGMHEAMLQRIEDGRKEAPDHFTADYIGRLAEITKARHESVAALAGVDKVAA